MKNIKKSKHPGRKICLGILQLRGKITALIKSVVFLIMSPAQLGIERVVFQWKNADSEKSNH
jgi:hypothetical protein